MICHNKIATSILYTDISLGDDDITEFFTLMTPDECIKNGQQIVRENKLDVQVEGSEKAEEKMFEGTNRTAKRMHIICAGLSTHNVHSTTALVPVTITTNVCYVRHNQTLTDYLEMDGDLKNPSENTKELLKTIYTIVDRPRSQNFNFNNPANNMDFLFRLSSYGS